MVMAAHDIALEQEVESRIVEQIGSLVRDEGSCFLNLCFRIALEDVGAIEPLICEMTELPIEAFDAAPVLLFLESRVCCKGKEPSCDELPGGGFLGGELDGSTYKCIEAGISMPGFAKLWNLAARASAG